VRLLLDEMISPRVARELRAAGHDAQAIKADRPELEAASDRDVLLRAAAERRALVTNDMLDFQLLHDRLLASGEGHYGILFTDDTTLPRNRASIPLWTQTLAALLDDNQPDDALRNRVRHLP
jgi:predicted nuclease of predicted toxin-antitoxin system